MNEVEDGRAGMVSEVYAMKLRFLFDLNDNTDPEYSHVERIKGLIVNCFSNRNATYRPLSGDNG